MRPEGVDGKENYMPIECFIYEPHCGLESARDRVHENDGIVGAGRFDVLDKLEEQKIPIRGTSFLLAGAMIDYCVYATVMDLLRDGANSVTVNCLESRAKTELTLGVVLSPQKRAETICALLREKADDPRLKFITE